MASKRDRRVAFADDVDTENKKARRDDRPSSDIAAFERSEYYIFEAFLAHGNLHMCMHTAYIVVIRICIKQTRQLLSEDKLYMITNDYYDNELTGWSS